MRRWLPAPQEIQQSQWALERASLRARRTKKQAGAAALVAGPEPGDTVRVHTRIVEGDRERVQVFQGTVIRLRSGGETRSIPVVVVR